MDAATPEEELKMLEIKLNQLKLDYEKYFLGTRPTEPAMQRAEIQKIVIKWANTRITNTAQRFKFNSLNGRYQAFKRQWDNILRQIEGQDLLPAFDGHANCFIETGFGKAILIDFNYDVEPLPGRFPLAKVGPMKLLEESRMNHWGKLAFRWIYWNLLLRGRWLPIPTRMSMVGKRLQPVGKE